MTVLKYAAVVTLSLAFTIGWAGGGPAPGEDQADQEKPSLFVSHFRSITGVVEAIDHESRMVTLRGPEGNSIAFTAGEEVRNLAQIEAGDLASAKYVYNLSIEVYDNPGLIPSEQNLAAMGRTGEGEMPGLGAAGAYVVTATLEAINFETGTIKLKWPDETVDEFTAEEPENLRGAAVGDLVVITQTASMAVSVEEVAAE